jgi:phosphate:Na+ symporter
MLLVLGTFIGGLGFFLLAVSMITNGLKLAAGDALRRILANSTATRLRGVGSGVLVTGIVQSSSAVTVATIGFVNAGLLTLNQSLGVVYGANIGTTMTGWIVAAVGFSFKVEALALPLIGVGMLARMLRPNSRFAPLGEALAGFGLFFIGVDLLRDAFEGFSASVDVASFAPQSGLGVLLYLLLGFLMTVVTQSSSAAIAITLTAATGGVLGINAAAAMVIGANVGTTSTAAFAVIGATANARRVAAVHVVFNLLTGLVALALLPVLMWIVRSTGDLLGLQDIPAVSLALFHTVFNVLGVLLMWPITDRLSAYLAGRFTTEEERLAQPAYLDRNVMATPVLAMDALSLELNRLAGLVRDLVESTVSGESGAERAARAQGLRTLIDAIEQFVSELELEQLPAAQKGSLPVALRVIGYLEEVLGILESLEDHTADIQAILVPRIGDSVAAFQAQVVAQIARSAEVPEIDIAELEEGYEKLRGQWHDLKDALLAAATARTIPIRPLNSSLEGLRGYLKMAEQLTKAGQRLHVLSLSAEEPNEESDVVGSPDSEQLENET